jgi:hypothetical protein
MGCDQAVEGVARPGLKHGFTDDAIEWLGADLQTDSVGQIGNHGIGWCGYSLDLEQVLHLKTNSR